MEKTLSRIRNLRARRKLSLPASPSPSGFSKISGRSESEDDLEEWSVRIKSLLPDPAKGEETQQTNLEVKKSNSERRKVQWDPTVPKFSGRALSEKCYRKRRSGSVSVIPSSASGGATSIKTFNREEASAGTGGPGGGGGGGGGGGDNNSKPPPAWSYPRHGSLPHAFRNGNQRHHLGELLVLACLSSSPQGDPGPGIENQYGMNFDFIVSDEFRPSQSYASVLFSSVLVIYSEN